VKCTNIDERGSFVGQFEYRREMSPAPGFLCPICQQVRIKVSLAAFLTSNEVVCPNCGSTFEMDKSGCSRMVELLQELYIADQNVQALLGKANRLS